MDWIFYWTLFTKRTTPTSRDASYLIMIPVEFWGAEDETFRPTRQTGAIRSKRFKSSNRHQIVLGDTYILA